MRLVIDIPEERYNDIRTKNEHSQIFNAVKNGIPLPKGHGRLIDADKIMRVDHIVLESTIDDAPTIIEADKEDGYEIHSSI